MLPSGFFSSLDDRLSLLGGEWSPGKSEHVGLRALESWDATLGTGGFIVFFRPSTQDRAQGPLSINAGLCNLIGPASG